MVCVSAFLAVIGHQVNFYSITVSVNFNDATINDRAVIFHDEVANFVSDSNLLCQSSTTVASWHYPNGTAVGSAMGGSENEDYLQLPLQTDVLLVRNKDAVDINPLNNGLWTCRLGDEFVPVGIYHRRGKCNFLVCSKMQSERASECFHLWNLAEVYKSDLKRGRRND